MIIENNIKEILKSTNSLFPVLLRISCKINGLYIMMYDVENYERFVGEA